MKKALAMVLAVVIALSLTSCKNETPDESDIPAVQIPPATEQGTPEKLPNVQDETGTGTEATPVPEPIPIEESCRDIVTMIASDFSLLVSGYSLPDVKPNDEQSIDDLREWMRGINELELPIRFDDANLGMSDYGYRINFTSPGDYYGNPICVWIQDAPSGRQTVLVASGEDGIFTYQGYGHDYTGTGFGDDDVRVLDI